MTKNYKAAPLPFIGQKRLFLKDFKAMLAEIEGDGEGWTIVDVFGGSGLLAHTAKRAKPKARVIYNDYDNYSERLANIDSTNALRREIHRLLAPMPKDGSLSAEIAGQIRTAILAHQAAGGYIDIGCLNAWLCFGGDWKPLEKILNALDLWSRVAKTDYNADGYLDGLIIEAADYRELLQKYRAEKTLFVFDPPYIKTMQGMYANSKYFDMVAFLELMDNVAPPFVFFSGSRSELPAYVDYLKKSRPHEWRHKFEGAVVKHRVGRVNASAAYKDNMIYNLQAV